MWTVFFRIKVMLALIFEVFGWLVSLVILVLAHFVIPWWANLISRWRISVFTKVLALVHRCRLWKFLRTIKRRQKTWSLLCLSTHASMITSFLTCLVPRSKKKLTFLKFIVFVFWMPTFAFLRSYFARGLLIFYCPLALTLKVKLFVKFRKW